ncbi:glycosyl hydrolase [Tabrizicola sp.]|uniref:glycoside hydrolase family 26 protein n=1 Tax=Tabrizicola sp. TaxID=2005166 RepID=UPI0026191727|nr:glycosyl hydrolase [Tabrizicola sp.]MDM7930355.1 glycosyl hydrolase [Tabrizicola sp.]
MLPTVPTIKTAARLRLAQVALLAPILALIPPPLTAAPPGPLPFGVYDPQGDFISDPEVSIEHVFMPWEDVSLSSLLEADLYALERNRALLITVEPWTWTRDERNTANFLRRGIDAGYYDANMRSICNVIATLQSPVSVRWGHEMETDDGQFIWSAWNPADYIRAYRRMIDVCRAAAPDINVVWSPIGLENANDYYPGDDYVDLVGLSIFGLEAWEIEILGGALSFDEILEERYNRVKVHGKPVLVAELGYSGKADYVDLWEGQVRKQRPEMPLLVGAAYFNQPEVYEWPDGFGLPDWRIDQRVLP